MSFSFGFSGDDVEDENDVVVQDSNANGGAEAKSQFVGLPAEEHAIDDLVGPWVYFVLRSCNFLEWLSSNFGAQLWEVIPSTKTT